MAIISTTGPSGISVTQMLWQCIDWTDPENPIFKTSGGGGGGGGGSVSVTSIAPGDNNIGNVDIASFPANTFAGLTPVTMDFDTGAGVASLPFFGLARSANGGPVELGTASTPIRTDPTGTTTQPVSVASALPAGDALIGRVKPAVISQAIDIAPVSVSSSAGGSDLFATADSTRQHIVFRNTSSVDCWAQPFGTTPQVGRGFCLKANGGEKAFTGDYAGAAWKAIAASGTGTISIGGAKT